MPIKKRWASQTESLPTGVKVKAHPTQILLGLIGYLFKSHAYY